MKFEIVAQKITTNLDVRLRNRSGTNKDIILKNHKVTAKSKGSKTPNFKRHAII